MFREWPLLRNNKKKKEEQNVQKQNERMKMTIYYKRFHVSYEKKNINKANNNNNSNYQ